MQLLSRFLRARKREVRKLDASSLGVQISSAINAFLSVRGLNSLLKSETAIVMRKEYETFITQAADRIENRETVTAVVYLKGMESYEQFKKIQTDGLLRSSTLGYMATDYLANQVARQLLGQVAGQYEGQMAAANEPRENLYGKGH